MKKQFLSKVYQYIKDRVLDAKYACAFLYNIVGSQSSESEEVSMLELISHIYFCILIKCISWLVYLRNFEGLLAGSFSYLVSRLIL